MKASILRWWTILLPAAGIVAFDYARHEVVAAIDHTWWEEAALLLAVLAVSFSTSQFLLSRLAGSEQREREAQTLRTVAVELASSLDLGAIVSLTLTRGRTLLCADCLGIAIAESPATEMTVLAPGTRDPVRIREADYPALLKTAIEAGQRLDRHGEDGDQRHWCHIPCRCCSALPLRTGQHPLGALCVGFTDARTLDAATSRLACQIAGAASVAIANSLLHRQSQHVAVLTERERIAREIHDGVAQALAYISVTAAGSHSMLQMRGQQRQTASRLAAIGQAADEAYLDVREAILGLRKPAGGHQDFLLSLREYLDKYSRQFGTAAKLTTAGEIPANLPPRVEIQLVRVIQEALTNVRKHSAATEVVLDMQRLNGSVRVTVKDNGHGFLESELDTGTLNGYGLTTMRERLAEIGGTLSIHSAPGIGTSVVATVPLEESNERSNPEG